MKNYLLLALFAIFGLGSIQAQHCGNASNNITPITFGNAGLYPTPDLLPCAVMGQPVYDTIYFQNYSTVGTFTVTSLKIDSINNLPPGLCWTTNQANNTFSGGQAGVIYVTGTPTGPVGQYKLRIIIDVVTNVITLTNQNAETLTGQFGTPLRYWVRLKCASASCTAIDTSSPYPNYISYAACSGAPTANVTPAGPVTLCSGATQTLTANAGNGYTYQWSTGATTQSISASTAGSYTVTVYSGVDSAVSAPVVVSLGTNPTASVSPSGRDSICRGDTITISASPTGAGYTYHWSNNATTATIQAARTGRYVVTVTNSSGCTDTAALIVVVKQRPLATVSQTPTSACVGDTVTLTAQPGYSYQWGTATTQSITMTASGNYGLTVTSPNGCTASSSGSVTFNTPPVATITQAGQTLTASAGASYQWYNLQGPIGNATAQTFNVVSNNTYTVKVTGANGCSAISAPVVITNAGINDVSGNISLKLYPNPSEGILTLEAEALTAAHYEITDQLGRVIQAKNITTDSTPIDISGQMSGVYYLSVRSTQGERTMRLVIMK